MTRGISEVDYGGNYWGSKVLKPSLQQRSTLKFRLLRDHRETHRGQVKGLIQ